MIKSINDFEKRITCIITTIMLLTTCGLYVFADDSNKLSIKVYVNNNVLTTAVYENTNTPEVQGNDYLSVYVELISVFETLEAKVKVDNSNVIFVSGEKVGNLKIVVGRSIYKYNDSSFEGKYTDYSSNEKDTTIIDGKNVISFSKVRHIIDGSLKQDKDAVYLYSSDFERIDIPATLEECYVKLNKELDENEKTKLKNASKEDLAQFHFSLGAWIRNNWIYPTDKRITKVFLDKGIRHPDIMSSQIIVGYHNYLNNEAFEVKTQSYNYNKLIILIPMILLILLICIMFLVKHYRFNKLN